MASLARVWARLQVEEHPAPWLHPWQKWWAPVSWSVKHQLACPSGGSVRQGEAGGALPSPSFLGSLSLPCLAVCIVRQAFTFSHTAPSAAHSPCESWQPTVCSVTSGAFNGSVRAFDTHPPSTAGKLCLAHFPETSVLPNVGVCFPVPSYNCVIKLYLVERQGRKRLVLSLKLGSACLLYPTVTNIYVSQF